MFALRDTVLQANVPTYFRVVPSSGLNVELRLHTQAGGHDVTGPGPAVGGGVELATGSGGAEAMYHQSPISQTDGLMVINREGSGTATIYRDTTAPTGRWRSTVAQPRPRPGT